MKVNPFVTQYLENIKRTALQQYPEIIRRFVRKRHGIYALFKGTRLYYLGLATDLRGRLKGHLRDRHGSSWDRFSVYITIGDNHMKELETLLLRMFKPKGNTHTGHFPRAEDLRGKFKQEIKLLMEKGLKDLLGEKEKERKRHAPQLQKKGKKFGVLARYRNHPRKLRAHFKGRKLKAFVRKDGFIRFNGRNYASPSLAGAAACRRTCNGWEFWTYERSPGDWVKLDNLRK